MASISGEIAFRVQKDAFDYLDAPIRRITTADVPLPYAPTLIEASLPNVTLCSIAELAANILLFAIV